VKPELPQDAKLASLPRDTRYHFVLLWTIADDAGYFRAGARYLLGQLYPHDEDVTERDVQRMSGELLGAGFVDIVLTPDSPIGWVKNWSKHQRIDRPSASHLAESFASVPTQAIGPANAGVLSPESLVLSPESSSSPRVATAQVPDQTAQLAGRLVSDADRTALAGVVGKARSVVGCVSHLLMVLNGGDHPTPTPVQLGAALRDFDANETTFNASHFRAYIRRAMAGERAPPPASGNAFDTPEMRAWADRTDTPLQKPA
jgi:hypothetical protein